MNTRAAVVRFGAAVLRFCAAVLRFCAAVLRLGAGEAHQPAVRENEQRRANGLFWPFFDVFWRFWGGKGVAKRAFGRKLANSSKWCLLGPFGVVWAFFGWFSTKNAMFRYISR